MSFDIAALRHVAITAGVPTAQVAEVVEGALRDAFTVARGTADDLTITVDDATGSVDVRDGSGTQLRVEVLGARATAAARQSVVSWLRDLERVRKVGPWAQREGRAIRAIVRSVGRDGEVRLDAQGTFAVMPAGESVDTEVLRPGEEISVLLLNANVTDRDVIRLTVSRRQPALVAALFDRHLAGTETMITGVAREPGVRTKVAFEGAVADLVGPGGLAVRAVMNELGGERIDLIAKSEDLAVFAATALSPATVISATLTDPARRVVAVEVAPDQLATAAGVGGINLRLATRLTGARIELLTTPAPALAA